MNTLVLVNSWSPGYAEAPELVLPYLDHLGVVHAVVDLAREPLPDHLEDYALVLVAHRRLGATRARVGATGRKRILDAVRAGTGLVTFDPTFPAAGDLGVHTSAGKEVEARSIDVASAHFVTSGMDTAIALAGPMRVPALGSGTDGILLAAGGHPLLAVHDLGAGRVVRWATCRWAHTSVLGPLGGLDGALWRGLVWAARKPFCLRGLPPIVTMRVDDVAGRGARFGKSPLYWVETANRHGFLPWLGLFLYNLRAEAVNELRECLLGGRATAFPHAFGRPPRTPDIDFDWYDKALPLRAREYDEFIYFDHQKKKSWTDAEAKKGLAAVDDWYVAHAPLPMSKYCASHWLEMGSNVMAHVRGKWGSDLIAKCNDVDTPFAEATPWIKAGPFRLFEKPGSASMDEARRGKRPVYYADFVSFAGQRFFDCMTEIRDVAGYEWAPDVDVSKTVDRGVQQLQRALDSMAPAVLFTHETDYVEAIPPDVWEQEISRIAQGIAVYEPMQMTLDDAAGYVRATRTSRLASCRYDEQNREIVVRLRGEADRTTHVWLFSETDGVISKKLVPVPEFEGEVVLRHGV
jgi:hypothetical protein